MSDWLEPGQSAPDFSLPDDKANRVSLKDFRGKIVVLYFYPEDDTPGCTIQACSFRDAIPDLKEQGVVVLGVSGNSVDSHVLFRDKFKLNFPLLADVGFKVSTTYGAYREKNMYGKKVMGIVRSTYIIDEQGKIARVIKRVLADRQIPQLQKALEALQGD